MFIVKLMNEFVHGVLWVCDEDGISTNYDLIDNDKELAKLNEETRKLFDSYYEFDSHDQGCWFNEELERRTKDQMLELIRKIKNRLSEINDGTFKVEDCETERLKKL
jgi:RNA polymerase-binding transcription factor DksA